MTNPPQDNFFSCVPDSAAAVHRFRHKAMASVFEMFIVCDDASYAGQVALAAFDELDSIEQNLSRFIENSDISQINNLPAGQPLHLGPDAFECLRLSAKIYEQTGGAFDITIGSLPDCRPGMGLLNLDEAEHTVTLSAAGVQIDLGGVGKGYAVDRMTEILDDWSIDAVLIHAGQSSVRAIGALPGAKGWPVIMTDPRNRRQILARFDLRDRALSGSGLQKGPHIIDPHTGIPVEDERAAWSSAPDAATADALSTAFMVMSPDRIKDYCHRFADTQAMIILQDEILRFGPWKKLKSNY
ncbi:MAG: FAD:protein FMN transferase [Planctomycetota bacterium]|jgi:thiamine biosynthesis lipoprotein